MRKEQQQADGFAEEILSRVARLVWEERRADLDAYLSDAVEERDRREGRRTSGTGTDGAVVSLDDRRRSR